MKNKIISLAILVILLVLATLGFQVRQGRIARDHDRDQYNAIMQQAQANQAAEKMRLFNADLDKLKKQCVADRAAAVVAKKPVPDCNPNIGL